MLEDKKIDESERWDGLHGLITNMQDISVHRNHILSISMNGEHFKPENHFAFEATAWYWHFVDVIWLFLFCYVYIFPLR